MNSSEVERIHSPNNANYTNEKTEEETEEKTETENNCIFCVDCKDMCGGILEFLGVCFRCCAAMQFQLI